MGIPWPAGAPQFAESWEEQNQPLTIRTNMDVGPPKVRRRATRSFRSVTVSFTCRHDQWRVLKDFFQVDCQSGVQFHEFLHPFEGTVQEFRFIEAPQVVSVISFGVTVNCQWEQL